MEKPYTAEIIKLPRPKPGPIVDVPPNWRRLGPVAAKFVSGLAPDST